jgi:thiol-disulfide isomerase/thioredoxin
MMRRGFLALVIVVVGAGSLWFGLERATEAVLQQPYSPPAPELPPAAPALQPGEKVAFLELGSVGCKPCEAMKPVMQAVRERFPDRVEVTFYDVRKLPAIAGEYGVRLIPTQVFLLPDGTEFFRHEGFFGEDDVMAVLTKMGVR